MATLNKIALTNDFQDLTTLITGFLQDQTYYLQVQGPYEVQLVETKNLANASGYVKAVPGQIIKYKYGGVPLYAKSIKANSFISVWEGE